MADYRGALKIEGWMTEEELEWLDAVAQEMTSVTEVGCWKGRSTYALAAGCPGVVYAVDHFQGSKDELETTHKEAVTGDIRSQFEANVAKFNHKIVIIKKNSLDAAASVPDTDMVFIDAGHTYDEVVADLKAWRGKAKKLLCGHDFDFPEVRRAIIDVLGGDSDIAEGPGSLWFYPIVYVQNPKSILYSAGEDYKPAPPALLPRLVVCLPGEPAGGGWSEAWDALHAELLQVYRVTRIYARGNNIYDVRNECVLKLAEACSKMSDPPEHVLWIDSDNVGSMSGFLSLRQALDSMPEAAMVGAWYLMQMHYGEQPLITAGTGDQRPSIEHIKHAASGGMLLPVEYIGFGFLLMRYSLLDSLGLNPFRTILRDDGDQETDDVSFCIRVNRLNSAENPVRIFLHPAVYSPHLKLQPIPIATRAMKSAAVQSPAKERIILT